MRYYRCKCGNLESWSSMGSPDCYGCPDCNTTLAETPRTHEEPQPHKWEREWKIADPKTGESAPFRRCIKCGRGERDPDAVRRPDERPSSTETTTTEDAASGVGNGSIPAHNSNKENS